MSTFNVSTKVNRAITGATTVSAGAYAVVDYVPTAITDSGTTSGFNPLAFPPVTRNFGPGQSVPASFTINVFAPYVNNHLTYTLTYTLSSGYEMINTL